MGIRTASRFVLVADLNVLYTTSTLTVHYACTGQTLVSIPGRFRILATSEKSANKKRQYPVEKSDKMNKVVAETAQK